MSAPLLRVVRTAGAGGGRRCKSSAVDGALEVALHDTPSRAEVEAVTRVEVDSEWARARPYSSMPGPPPLPLLGNSWRFLPFIGDYRIAEVDRVVQRLHAQYGRVARLSGLLGRPDMVFLFHPDDIERVFRAEDAAPHRPSMPSLDYYKHVLRKDFFGDTPGVIAVHGEKWLEFRGRVQQVMLQPRTARLYVRPIEETADAFVRRVRQLKKASGAVQEMPSDFMNEIHKWSLESIARVALDARLGCLDAEAEAPADTQRLIDAVTTFFTRVGELELKVPLWRLWSTPAWRQYVRALDDITQVTSQYISAALQRWRARGGPLREDSSLLERVLAQNEDPRVACALALDMFLVGIDTTSTAVASVLYQLALHPVAQERLHREVARALPPSGVDSEPLSAERLESMAYLRAVIKETLRMYPVVIGNGRTVTQDTVIAGYQIPKGTQLVFQHYVISNQERYFPQASRFLPERWLRAGAGAGEEGGCPVASHKAHPFASLPFGFGRRMCLGRRFADLEIQTVIAKMIQAFRVEWPHDPLTYRIHPMYTPDGPLRFRLVDRHDG